jgi:outer membrane protein OmpA-like peptidoglycan-associated protein
LPLISRYPGSVIQDYDSKEFDEYELIVGPCARPKDKVECKTQHLEGKVAFVSYDAPKGRSILEIFRNYQQALMKAGFKQIYTCHDNECGTAAPQTDLGFIKGWDNRYWVAKLARPTGDVYAAVNTDGSGETHNQTHILVVELKPMEGGMVVASAAALADDLAKTGHSALYGIYFDTGKAEVKPESEPALVEVAKLLTQDSGLKLIVAGHTDNVGGFASNMDLSRKRAEAVVAALTSRGIAAARLNPQGLGPCAPVASNDDESGRARNRRVELVRQ